MNKIKNRKKIFLEKSSMYHSSVLTKKNKK